MQYWELKVILGNTSSTTLGPQKLFISRVAVQHTPSHPHLIKFSLSPGSDDTDLGFNQHGQGSWPLAVMLWLRSSWEAPSKGTWDHRESFQGWRSRENWVVRVRTMGGHPGRCVQVGRSDDFLWQVPAGLCCLWWMKERMWPDQQKRFPVTWPPRRRCGCLH